MSFPLENETFTCLIEYKNQFSFKTESKFRKKA